MKSSLGQLGTSRHSWEYAPPAKREVPVVVVGAYTELNYGGATVIPGGCLPLFLFPLPSGSSFCSVMSVETIRRVLYGRTIPLMRSSLRSLPLLASSPLPPLVLRALRQLTRTAATSSTNSSMAPHTLSVDGNKVIEKSAKGEVVKTSVSSKFPRAVLGRPRLALLGLSRA